MSEETKARLDAMTDEMVDQNARDDPDNQPFTIDELNRLEAAIKLRSIRARTGLSQAQFAARYRIKLARLRDWEQGRHAPDTLALAYLRVIEAEPEAVARALSAA